METRVPGRWEDDMAHGRKEENMKKKKMVKSCSHRLISDLECDPKQAKNEGLF